MKEILGMYRFSRGEKCLVFEKFWDEIIGE
jgi:hypothetical protein